MPCEELSAIYVLEDAGHVSRVFFRISDMGVLTNPWGSHPFASLHSPLPSSSLRLLSLRSRPL